MTNAVVGAKTLTFWFIYGVAAPLCLAFYVVLFLACLAAFFP